MTGGQTHLQLRFVFYPSHLGRELGLERGLYRRAFALLDCTYGQRILLIRGQEDLTLWVEDLKKFVRTLFSRRGYRGVILWV